jgi:hypothetical protein
MQCMQARSTRELHRLHQIKGSLKSLQNKTVAAVSSSFSDAESSGIFRSNIHMKYKTALKKYSCSASRPSGVVFGAQKAI